MAVFTPQIHQIAYFIADQVRLGLPERILKKHFSGDKRNK